MRRRARPTGSGGEPGVSARTAALRLLGRRDYTAAEITARLTARGYPDVDVAAAVDRLRANRLIDDLRAARAHVRTAGAVKARGRLRIRRELEARGISRETAELAGAEWTPDDERQAIGRLIARKAGDRPLTPVGRRRLIQQLLRRGFPLEAIRSELGRRATGSPTPDTDD